MFAYLIIAIELSLIYAVYWFACEWEPRPYKLQNNLWGKYEEVPTWFPIDGDNSRPKERPAFLRKRHRVADPQIYFSEADNVIVSKRVGGSECRMKGFSNDLRYGWVIEQKRRRDENILAYITSLITRALSYLTLRTL